MKLKNKMVLSFGSVFVATMLVLGIVVGYFSSQTFHREVENSLRAIVISKAEGVRTYIKAQETFTVGLGGSLGLKDFFKSIPGSADFKSLYEREKVRFVKTLGASPEILEFEILDRNGIVVVATGKTPAGSNKSTDMYFVNGKTGIYFKDIYFSETYKQLIYTISAPIKDDQSGELLGVVVAKYDPKVFFATVANPIGLGTTGESFLVNKDKYFVTPSKYLGEGAILAQKVDTQNVRDCFDTRGIEAVPQQYVDYRGVSILGTHAYIPETGWCLVGKIDAKEVFAPSAMQGYIFGAFTVAATIVFLILGLLISRSISEPIERLKRGMEIVGGGNLDYRVGTKSLDEIGVLSRSFDQMTEMIKTARGEVDAKVEKQTKEIQLKSKDLEEQQKAIINVLEDVEEEKKISEQRAIDLQKFRQAVENATDHMVITDADGMVLYANLAVSRITGFSRDEVLGRKAGTSGLWGGLMQKDFYEKMWRQMKTEKLSFVGEITNRRKTGEEYIAQVSISPILDKNGEVVFFVGVERDITKEKEIDRMKTEFVSLVTHQLRTPITSIKWTLEMLMAEDEGELSQSQKTILQNAMESNNHMDDLVGSLLNISRMESGRIMIEPKMTVMVELVKNVLSELVVQTKEKNIKVELSSSFDSPVNIDPKLIGEVCKNLLTNAVKYSNVDGVVRVDISRVGDEVVCRVADSGFGIPKEEQARIFQKFFRASNIAGKIPDGTGLGLYLAKQVVETSGGKIGFESEEGRGSTFWFSLPISGMKQKVGEVSMS